MTTLAEALTNPEMGKEVKEIKKVHKMAKEFQTRLYEEVMGVPSIGSTFKHNDGETYRLIEMKTDSIKNELTGYGICVNVADENDAEESPSVMDPKLVYFPQIKEFENKDPSETIGAILEIMSDFDMNFEQLMASDITDFL